MEYYNKQALLYSNKQEASDFLPQVSLYFLSIHNSGLA